MGEKFNFADEHPEWRVYRAPPPPRKLTLTLPQIRRVLNRTLGDAYNFNESGVGLKGVNLDKTLFELCLAANVEPPRGLKRAVKRSEKIVDGFEPQKEEPETPETPVTPMTVSGLTFTDTQEPRVGERVLVTYGWGWDSEGILEEIFRGFTIKILSGDHAGESGGFNRSHFKTL